MLIRVAVICLCVLGIGSAFGEELSPEQARTFVVGKLFAYNCFDGTAGMGRIFADGSVIGTIQARGSHVMRFAVLPPGTITVTHSAVCAHLSGLFFQPCFRVQKFDYRTFRGSIWGLGFAYCDFHERNPRAASRRRPSRHQRNTALALTPPGP
jgi:hypothetical protein